MAIYNDLRRPIAEDKEFNKHYSLTSRLVRLKTNLAPPAGLEPATPWLTVRCYYRLSYGGIYEKANQNDSPSFFGSPDWTWTSDTLINSQVLLPTELRRNIETQQECSCWVLLCRHLSIFPGSCPPSIFDANELNFCVRNGNRWTLAAIGTDYQVHESEREIMKKFIWITKLKT